MVTHRLNHTQTTSRAANASAVSFPGKQKLPPPKFLHKKTQSSDTPMQQMTMKMSGGVAGCCVALLLVLKGVSAVQKLDSISDLQRINSVPKHSLMLLHWFANEVTIDQYNVMWLNFDPQTEYGSHHYGNYDELLDPVHRGHQYYTVGSLNQDTSEELPDHVIDAQRRYTGRNRGRIIFRVHRRNIIDEVYLTQHYDPDHTYQISSNLLRQIREFSSGSNLSHLRNRYRSSADESQLWSIRNTWGHLACLGLLLFIVTQERSTSYQHQAQTSTARQPDTSSNRERQSNEGPWWCLFVVVVVVLVVIFVLAMSAHNQRGFR